jgi:2-desacetyl-2-hydroxyethyl bacteriochlorophyllide A dehydrogenase
MKRQSLYFVAPKQIGVHEEDLDAPHPGEVQVRTICSAISAGTELLLYRGEAPSKMAADENLTALNGDLTYPLKFGYATIGEVVELGDGVDAAWKGKRVFAFNPHESRFNILVKDVQTVPAACSDEDAVFLAYAETAVNLVLDANPRIDERAVVIGQGVLGLLCSAILAQHPLSELISFDPHEHRRNLSEEFGVVSSFDQEAKKRLGDIGADFVIELSGHPEALELALDLVGKHGRVLIGSWYGLRRTEVDLGGRFHRGRIQLISSQVSSIAPSLTGRWDRKRRFDVAWNLLSEIKPSKFVTQRMALTEAESAYSMLDAESAESLSILFSY